jgi:hypothetical protein
MVASMAGSGAGVFFWVALGSALEAAGLVTDSPSNAFTAVIPALIGAAFGTPYSSLTGYNFLSLSRVNCTHGIGDRETPIDSCPSSVPFKFPHDPDLFCLVIDFRQPPRPRQLIQREIQPAFNKSMPSALNRQPTCMQKLSYFEIRFSSISQ